MDRNYNSIHCKNKSDMSKDDIMLWWSNRSDLDIDLSNLLNKIEDKIFGWKKCLLINQNLDDYENERIYKNIIDYCEV